MNELKLREEKGTGFTAPERDAAILADQHDAWDAMMKRGDDARAAQRRAVARALGVPEPRPVPTPSLADWLAQQARGAQERAAQPAQERPRDTSARLTPQPVVAPIGSGRVARTGTERPVADEQSGWPGDDEVRRGVDYLRAAMAGELDEPEPTREPPSVSMDDIAEAMETASLGA